MNDKLVNATIESLAQSVSNWYNPNRQYHNINHVKDMLKQLSESSCNIGFAYPEIDWEVLITSILWHDAGYKPGYALNEFEAADLYRHYCGSNAKREVIEAIISTIPFHDKGFPTPEQKVLHDLDWFGFMSYEKMLSNEAKIIEEAISYLDVTRSFVKNNQLKFYKKILDEGKPLYVTTIWEEYNAQAFANIRLRIGEMENEGVGF